MQSPNSANESDRGRSSKVAGLISKYNLQGLGAKMEQMWIAEEDRSSLRELARHFNQQVLKQSLEYANMHLLDREVKNIYDLLTDDDVSGADQTRTRRRIEKNNIDVNSLKKDFVTYQAIRFYLTEYRNAEYTSSVTDPLEREATNLKKLRGRTVSVTDGKLQQLRASGQLSLGDFRTIVDIQVICEECNTQFDVFELLELGACNCSED
jgi:hypothetical protein